MNGKKTRFLDNGANKRRDYSPQPNSQKSFPKDPGLFESFSQKYIANFYWNSQVRMQRARQCRCIRVLLDCFDAQFLFFLKDLLEGSRMCFGKKTPTHRKDDCRDCRFVQLKLSVTIFKIFKTTIL